MASGNDAIGLARPFDNAFGASQRFHVFKTVQKGVNGVSACLSQQFDSPGIQVDAPTAADYDNAAEVGFNCARGTIRGLAYLGSSTTYHVALESGMVVKITKANDARHDEVRLAQGDAVHVWWWGSDVVVLTQ